MEDGRNLSTVGTQDSIMMKSLQQKQSSRSSSDILSSRQKNRERQRRYRARKRLEAERRKAALLDQSARPREFLEENGDLNISMVPRGRDWKKDARNAHAHTISKEVPKVCMSNGKQTTYMAPLMRVESPLETKNQSENLFSFPSSETVAKLGKRDWKAEARRKID